MTQDHTTHDGLARPARPLRALWRRCHGLLSPAPLGTGLDTPAERERARRGRLLGTLLAANLPIAAVQILAAVPRSSVSTMGQALFFLLLIVCARLNHRRRTWAACRLFVAAQFLVGVALMAGSSDGQAIPGLVAGIFMVLLSGFLVSRRAPFVAAVLSTALVVADGLRHPRALPMPPGHAGPLLPVLVSAPGFFFLMLAVITSLGAGSLEDALARADEADALERRVAERTAALAESRERLHFALKGADLGAWSCDVVTSQATLSEECCRLLGLPPEQTLVHRDDLVRMIHPDDRQALQEKTAAAARAGAGYQHEVRIVRPDGGTRWLATMGRFSHDAATGELRTVDGAVMDITERKAMEAERERLLAEAIARADRDALTGLLNHRAFHRRLDEEADRAQRTGQPLAVAMLDLDNFKFFNDAYGHLAGDDVIRQVAAALQGACRSYDTLARFGGDEFALLMPGAGVAEASGIAARAQDALDVLGFRPPGHDVAIPLSLSVGLAVFPDDGPTRLGVLEQADQRLYRAKTGGGDRDESDRLRAALTQHMSGFPMLDALVTAVDNKDRYTRRHSEDVLTYSLQIAEKLGLDEATRDTVAVAALLHDVGKIGVADAVLRKPGALTEEETEAVRQHPMMGAVIVGAMAGFEATLDAIRHHHERWDGGGYPYGLAGAACPQIARLMAVADAFSAMTTDRPYRKGMAEARALEILASGAGTQWDPACVSAFMSIRHMPSCRGCETPGHAHIG